MEKLHPDARLLEHRRKGEARFVEPPGRGEIAAILVAVGIADHHFLMAARTHQCANLGQREIG